MITKQDQATSPYSLREVCSGWFDEKTLYNIKRWGSGDIFDLAVTTLQPTIVDTIQQLINCPYIKDRYVRLSTSDNNFRNSNLTVLHLQYTPEGQIPVEWPSFESYIAEAYSYARVMRILILLPHVPFFQNYAFGYTDCATPLADRHIVNTGINNMLRANGHDFVFNTQLDNWKTLYDSEENTTDLYWDIIDTLSCIT